MCKYNNRIVINVISKNWFLRKCWYSYKNAFWKIFWKNGSLWIKFHEALCVMDKKSMKMTIFYYVLTQFSLIYLQINYLWSLVFFKRNYYPFEEVYLERRILELCQISIPAYPEPIKHPQTSSQRQESTA